MEKQQVLHILIMCFSLNYLTCTAHVPYCHWWPVWLCNIFAHYL